MPDPATRVTEILHAIDSGEDGAQERLFDLLYEELRRVAHGHLAGGPRRATLQATALVNEAYLRLIDKDAVSWENRRHFFFAASRAMRDVLVDEARRKSAKRRGGDRRRVTLEGVDVGLATPAEDMLALDDALQALEREDERRAQIVRLRYFGGLSEEEAAEALGVSKRTVSREWSLARARLAMLLDPTDDE